MIYELGEGGAPPEATARTVALHEEYAIAAAALTGIGLSRDC
jgi:hypothetical protein